MQTDETLARELSDLRAVMVRVDTKLDLMVTTTADHENRIRKLEAKLYVYSGGATVVGMLTGILFPLWVK